MVATLWLWNVFVQIFLIVHYASTNFRRWLCVCQAFLRHSNAIIISISALSHAAPKLHRSIVHIVLARNIVIIIQRIFCNRPDIEMFQINPLVHVVQMHWACPFPYHSLGEIFHCSLPIHLTIHKKILI